MVLFLKWQSNILFWSLKWTSVAFNDNGNDVKLLPAEIETAFWETVALAVCGTPTTHIFRKRNPLSSSTGYYAISLRKKGSCTFFFQMLAHPHSSGVIIHLHPTFPSPCCASCFLAFNCKWWWFIEVVFWDSVLCDIPAQRTWRTSISKVIKTHNVNFLILSFLCDIDGFCFNLVNYASSSLHMKTPSGLSLVVTFLSIS